MILIEIKRTGDDGTFRIPNRFSSPNELDREVGDELKRAKKVLGLDEDGSQTLEIVTEAERVVYEAFSNAGPAGQKLIVSRKTFSLTGKQPTTRETATLIAPTNPSLDRPSKVTFSNNSEKPINLARSPHTLLSTADLVTDFAIASNRILQTR